ncbi:hypothetical protein [Penaeicola halotolerans]|uniref:hypothetical protein n=1 Tax=Penaeicola halotolerans TaxID=2793196 RepID=UPI001CF91178|nr:hypothetical protein [Penaeicola halotolerans]
MTITSTPNEILRLLYDDLPASEAAACEEAIAADPMLKEEYSALKSAKDALDQLNLEPSAASIAKILAFASKNKPEKV